MDQTLCSHFFPQSHRSSTGRSLPARRMPVSQSLDELLASMQEFLAEARQELLQPRPQLIARILREAASLH